MNVAGKTRIDMSEDLKYWLSHLEIAENRNATLFGVIEIITQEIGRV